MLKSLKIVTVWKKKVHLLKKSLKDKKINWINGLCFYYVRIYTVNK